MRVSLGLIPVLEIEVKTSEPAVLSEDVCVEFVLSLGLEHVVRTNSDVGILLLPVCDQRIRCGSRGDDGISGGFYRVADGFGSQVCSVGGIARGSVFIFPSFSKGVVGRLV